MIPAPDTFASDYLPSARAAFFDAMSGDDRAEWNLSAETWLRSLSTEPTPGRRYDGAVISLPSERAQHEQPFRKAVLEADLDARSIMIAGEVEAVAIARAAYRQAQTHRKQTSAQRAEVALEAERLRAAREARAAK